MIVLVNPPNSAADKSGKTVWGKDKGVLGKLKAEFNVGKRDRFVCVLIVLLEILIRCATDAFS